MIHCTHHRDSGLLDQSNAARCGGCWDRSRAVPIPTSWWSRTTIGQSAISTGSRCGSIGRPDHQSVSGLSCPHGALAAYPVLDESDYSARQFAASLANIDQAAWQLKPSFVLPQDWPSRVFEWLNRHRPHTLENTDDHGGWPDDDDLRAAFAGSRLRTTRRTSLIPSCCGNNPSPSTEPDPCLTS